MYSDDDDWLSFTGYHLGGRNRQESAFDSEGPEGAPALLRGFLGSDPAQRRRLREFYAEFGPPQPLSSLDDDEVLERITTDFGTGRVGLFAEPIDRGLSELAPGTQVPVSTEPESFEEIVEVREAPKEAPPPVRDENDFKQIDQDKQAEALVTAAQAGIPFCEECERARRAS